MKKKKDSFIDMYNSLTDPILLAEARRKNAIEKMKEEKKADTGIY